jgi:hypothetical protein
VLATCGVSGKEILGGSFSKKLNVIKKKSPACSPVLFMKEIQVG